MSPAGDRFCDTCVALIQAAAAPAAAAAPTPPAPDMHWAAVLILGWITGGLVMLFWTFKEASFVSKIDPASKAFTMFAVSLVCTLGTRAPRGGPRPSIEHPHDGGRRD